MIFVTIIKVVFEDLDLGFFESCQTLAFLIIFGLFGCFVYNKLDKGESQRIYIPLFTLLGNISLILSLIFIMNK